MFTLRKTLAVLSVALAAGLLCAANKPPKPAPGPAYTLVQLKLPAGYSDSYAHSVNDAGQVVGYGVANTPTGIATHALVWESAAAIPTDLGNGRGSDANSINNLGQIAGDCVFEAGSNALKHPTVWIPNGLGGYDVTDLTGASGIATGINAAGVVVGYFQVGLAFVVVPEDTNQDGKPDRWYRDSNNDGANDLMFLVPCDTNLKYSQAWGINDFGWVVGVGRFNSGYNTILIIPDYTLANPWFCDEDGDGLNDLVIDLAVGESSARMALNNKGQVVSVDELFAVAADGTVMQTTALPPTAARRGYNWWRTSAINDGGQVVGWGFSTSSAEIGLLWQKDKGTILFESLFSNMAGLSNLDPRGINNRGLIVGYGNTSTGGSRAFLATPTGN
jgi:uncharacterized membrane protein